MVQRALPSAALVPVCQITNSRVMGGRMIRIGATSFGVLLILAFALAAPATAASGNNAAGPKGNRAEQIRSGAIAAVFPHQDITSAGPLTSIGVGSDLSCQVAFAGDSSFEFYGPDEDPADCGTMLSVGGQLYAPDFASHSYTATSNLGSYIPFTPVSQTGVTGSGTALDPYKVVTDVMAGSTGLSLSQTDTYVVGDTQYHTDIAITNTTGAPQDVIIYRAGDCYLAGSDFSQGSYDSASGAIACADPSANRIEQWIPHTPGSSYLEANFASLWSAIGSNNPLPDTCDCSTNQDTGAGLSWTVTAPASQSVTVSQATDFGGSAFRFTPTFGTDFSGVIARLHPNGGVGNINQETATIAWGDGAVTSATLGLSATDPAELDVTGEHTYWTTGTLPVTITITDPQTGISSFTGAAAIGAKYTAMGDSYSSGEGAGWPPGGAPNLPGHDWWLYQDPSGSPVNTDHLNRGVGNTCHRADTAYAHVVEGLLAAQGMTLQFVACSGGLVQDAFTAYGQVHNDRQHQGEGPQLGALGKSTSLVTLTFGGNNLDFPGIAKNCVTSTDYGCLNQDGSVVAGLGYKTKAGTAQDGTFTSSGTVQRPISTIKDFAKGVDKLIGTAGTCTHTGCDLHDALVLLYRSIKTQAPGARILVLGYPHFFPPGGTGNTCEHFGSLDQQWVNDRTNLADAVIKDAAEESGVAQYVDTYESLANHQECAGTPNFTVDPSTYQVSGCSTGSWINGIDLISGFFGTPENLHPNPCGHLAEGQITAGAYNSPPPLDPAGIASSDTFSLTSGQSQTATLTVPSGLARLNVTATWSYGSVAITLTDPAGASHQPIQTGPVYATFDLGHAVPGTWKLTETNTTTGDSGTINGSLAVSETSMPLLPPAGQIRVVSHTCGLIGSTAKLSVAVSHAADGRVAQYQWFDDNGHPQSASGPKGNTITMSSLKNQYRVIVLTTGTSGQHRYTTATLAVKC
jgi:hypothetical protein